MRFTSKILAIKKNYNTAYLFIYIYILRGFRKLVMISKNFKNIPNLIK